MRSFQFDPRVRYLVEFPCDHRWMDPLRRIYDCELVYGSKGEFLIEFSGERYVMRPGDIVIIPPDCLHTSFVNPGGSTFRHCIHFTWDRHPARDAEPPLWALANEKYRRELIYRVPAEYRKRLPLISRAEEHRLILPVLEMLFQQLRLAHPGADALLFPIIRYLLIDRESRPRGRQVHPLRGRAMFKLKKFIDENFANSIGFEDFTRACGLTRAHLCTSFRQLTGAPPMAYLLNLRLHHAQRLLREKNLSIKEVSHSVGLHDTNYFARAFRKKFQMSPREYAEQAR